MAGRLSLHICFRGFRWPLHDDYVVEVWSIGHELVATLTGQLIRHLVELHLGSVIVQKEIQSCLRKPLVKLPARPGSTPAERAQRRRLRRSRR